MSGSSSSPPAVHNTGAAAPATGGAQPGLPRDEPLATASLPPATGIRAQLARQFVATLGRIDNPVLLLMALPKAESFVPKVAAGLALLYEFAKQPEWPARSVAARLLGQRAATLSPEEQAAAWRTLIHLGTDRERWVSESASCGLGALLQVDPERWGPHVRAVFGDADDPLIDRAADVPAGAKRALLFAVVPAIKDGPDGARRVAIDVLDRAAGVDSSATRQLGSLIVGREVAEHLPKEALGLVERWAASGERARQWQAARAMTAKLRGVDAERAEHVMAQLQEIGDASIANALRGALKDEEDPAPPVEATHASGSARPASSGARVQAAEPVDLTPPANWETTAEIPVSDRIIDQVVGQDHSVEIVRLAAQQKRFVLMVGEPGTGKSMLAAAMAEMMGAHDLEDVLVVPNPESRINPQIEVTPAGEGERIVQDAKKKRSETETSINYLFTVATVVVSLIGAWYTFTTKNFIPVAVAMVIGFVLMGVRRFFRSPARLAVPKLLVNNGRGLEADLAPFVDATGFHAGALLGDVRHDPFQSGGYETPPHELVEPGAIHLAHRGVLFIDEVSTLSVESQQSLLTAIQEKRFPISGRTLGSSGTMMRTNPTPCDFLLILAGNMQDVEKMHPALRSRVRGYGYELYMNEEMPDTEENRAKLARFCAQEVLKDRKIPHLSRAAVDAVTQEARVRAGHPDRLTTRLRELGGLIRAAGDLAAQEGAELIEPYHVERARENTRTLEEQIASRNVAA